MYQKLKENGVYWQYLRKSRADHEAELHGAGETLKRHEELLANTATRLGVSISRTYKEVVSGEMISERPQMLQLLEDLKTQHCDGVFVVEVERLARGDTSDQGIVAKYFKFTETLIITPIKIYDPLDEFDEEYFEYGLFRSRQEFKTINRRIQRGRMASISEGKWIASTAPFGYERVKIKNDKGYTLQIVPEKAEIVRMIFDLYVNGEVQPDGSLRTYGLPLIADRLNEMGVQTVTGTLWSPATLRDMIRNEAYIGKVTWGKDTEKRMLDGLEIKKVRVHANEYQIIDGIHEAIISEEIFKKAQAIRLNRSRTQTKRTTTLQNPLSGILYCEKCGAIMTRLAKNSKTPYDALKCSNRKCDNVSSPMYLVEEKLLETLKNWIDGYRLDWESGCLPASNIDVKRNSIEQHEKELKKLLLQKENVYSLLEQGVYSADVFKERMSALESQLTSVTFQIKKLEQEIAEQEKHLYNFETFIPHFNSVLNSYKTAANAAAKNELLKSIVDHVTYIKTTPNRRGQRENANFELHIYPILPEYK